MAKDPIEERRRRGLRSRSNQLAQSADWMVATESTLKRAIEAASRVGGALRFGYSRDGGAFAIGIYGDGEPYTEFVACTADIDEILLDIIALYEDIADSQATEAVAKKRPTKGKTE